MKSTKLTTAALIIAGIIIGAVFVFFYPGPASGNVVFSLTTNQVDQTAAISAQATVESISFYNKARGWHTIIWRDTIIPLSDSSIDSSGVLLGRTTLPVGTYSRVQLTLTDAAATTTTSNTGLSVVAPTSNITFTADVEIDQHATSSLVFDLQVDPSLHQTQKDTIVFLPQIKLNSWSHARVELHDRQVETAGGVLESRVMVGVDAQGRSRSNFHLGTDARIELDADERIIISYPTTPAATTSVPE